MLLTGVSLAMNPRAWKEASALASVGHEVQVFGVDFSTRQLAIDQELAHKRGFEFVPIASVGNETLKRRLRWFFYRTRKKCASELQTLLHRESLFQLGYFIPELLSKAKAAKADYYIVHLEQAMCVGASLLNSGYRVGVDMEDWFSEDLPPEARKQRPVKMLKSLERGALSMASNTTCTSKAMSEALAREYGCRPPAVVYNAFPWSDRQTLDGQFKDRRDRTVPSLHWYSQTLGAGRGLEELFAALPQVKRPLEIHLRGHLNKGVEDWLWLLVPENWRKHVFLHPLVSNDELLSRIAEHDVGFAGEQKYCRSRDLTVTNKILHYLLGGLAVVASDTAGQREVAEQADGAVRLYPVGDSLALAGAMNALLGSREALQSAKAAALQSAEQTFCWERQTPVLVNSVETALTQ